MPRTLAFLAVGLLVFGKAQPELVGGTQGMAATNHPLATLTAMQILVDGGNAVDAAVAAAATLGVAEPYLSGLGGDGFMILYWAESDELYVLDFSGRVPANLPPEVEAENYIPFEGPLSMVVPGAAAGWEAARSRFGTMTAAELLAPAIAIAERGFPASAYAADAMSWAAAQFLDWNESGAMAWWNGDIIPPSVGDLIRNERLAQTYRSLVAEGLDSFYTGTVAEQIVAAVSAHGGVLAADDMASYVVEWSEPLHVNYRGYDLYAPRLNSTGGLATLQALKIVEGYDVAGLGSESPDYLHLLIEAVKLAARDRARWGGDPAFLSEPIPYERLLSEAYVSGLREEIDLRRAGPVADVGGDQPGTSHISVIDGQGNMVAMTVSIGSGWGSGFVAGETGLVLNNSLTLFDLEPGSPSRLEPGKRVPWNMSPMIVFRNGAPWMALGTPGGTGIWQTLPQILTRLIDFGQPLEEAIRAPRFRWSLSSMRVSLESRFGEETLEALAGWGHEVSDAGEWSIAVGAVTGVYIDENGHLRGAADPRREGYVIGW